MSILDFARCRRCSENPFIACSGNPFARLFGEADEGAKRIPDPARQRSRRLEADGDPRSEAEMRSIVQDWSHFVNTRALDFFQHKESPEALEAVLTNIAHSISRGCDPVCGPADRCVLWHGKKEGSNQAVMQLNKPKEGDSQVWVNRVLAFLFANDASFLELMKLAKQPFPMSCGNQLCINLSHVTPAVVLNECASAMSVTLHPPTPDPCTVSCTSVGGAVLATLEVVCEETTLAHVRTTVAQRLDLPPQTLRLLTCSGDVLPKARDDVLLCDLSL